jgi:hypothetical protein
MHAGKKLRVDCGDMCRYICESFRQRRSRGCDRVVGVAELAVVDSPILTSDDEIVAQGDVHQQIRRLRHADVENFEIRALVARTRENHLDFGGETGVVTNALERPKNTIVRFIRQEFACSQAPSPPKYFLQRHCSFANGARTV